ncbi:MAG: putative 4-mercaptohistidine N1-methyltransferase [Verrucomicrobiota bacterium]
MASSANGTTLPFLPISDLLNPYESKALLDQYLLFHYGTREETLPFPGGPVEALDFAKRTVSENLDPEAVESGGRALDLGCAVGRSAFELSRFCREVIGIDFSASFINAAEEVGRGPYPYDRLDEGALTTPLQARLPEGARPELCHFETGDAMNLRPDLGEFDIVHVANLLCRLPQPRRCLDRLPALLNPGGILIITSPYTWLDEFTPREAWLGGFRRDDRPIVTREALQTALEPTLTLKTTRELPFLIREHSRKYQWSVAQATVWKKPL